jgi:GntR family transcriptional regulator
MTNFSFQGLQNELATLIARAPAGQRMLNEPALAKQLGVSRATLREAIRMFETQGLIRRRQGSGTYVVGKVQAFDGNLEKLESLETMAQRLGREVSMSALNIEQISADKNLAAELNVAARARLSRIQRVICADGRPIAYLIDSLPEDVLHIDDLPANFRGSILDFLVERGDNVKSSRAEVSAVGATAEIAKALEIQRGDVLLHFRSQLFDASGKVLDYSLSYFIPGYFHFHITQNFPSSPALPPKGEGS